MLHLSQTQTFSPWGVDIAISLVVPWIYRYLVWIPAPCLKSKFLPPETAASSQVDFGAPELEVAQVLPESPLQHLASGDP